MFFFIIQKCGFYFAYSYAALTPLSLGVDGNKSSHKELTNHRVGQFAVQSNSTAEINSAFSVKLIWENEYYIFFQIESDTIVVTVSLSILNQIEFHLVQNQNENCYHDRISFNLKGYVSIVFSEYSPTQPLKSILLSQWN